MAKAEWTEQQIKDWIAAQSWYQKITLSNGLKTPGKVECEERLSFFNAEEFAGKTVLDIGCNSGYYCLWAKKQGSVRVVGIDIDDGRLAQAGTLAEIENLDIEYYNKTLSQATQLGRFDVVFCFAVLTEVQDLLGGLTALANVTGRKAFVELALAKPLIYLSMSRFWLASFLSKKYSAGILEIRPSKRGWMLSPSLRALRRLLPDEFKVSYLGKGPRYDMICIERIC